MNRNITYITNMEKQSSIMPKWFWVAAIILLVWSLLGVASFFQNILVSQEAIAALPEAERELYANYPLWTKIAYALAVFGGTLGCIGLLVRKKWVKPLLIISLTAVIIQMYHSLFIAGAMGVYGPGALVMPVMVIIISTFLVWMANYGIKKGWIV